ncbi:hypothetical protein QVD17_35302 [Tagetes erecta]|uniref:Uncharacterized protein n=1 Tax=Tagetes erecta TaxID=13708 RepID=A0AAD8JZN8_TARER|nr:hypothetical protein QVD17_35302 [Tagetes erecta]
MMRYLIFVLILESCLTLKSHSKSIVRRLPGYSGDLPFKLETGRDKVPGCKLKVERHPNINDIMIIKSELID